MAINNNAVRNRYVGNGATAVYNYTFEVFDAGDLVVYKDSAVQVLNTDYTVSGVGGSNGGTITFGSAPANGVVVTIVRHVPSQRTVDYQFSGNFQSDTVNKDYDRLWAKVQELEDNLNRTVRLADSDGPASTTLPLAGARSSLLLGFDAGGNLVPADVSTYTAAAAASATASANSATASDSSRSLAQEWADKAEDVAITGNPGKFSARNWANKAAASAASLSLPLITGNGGKYLRAKADLSGLEYFDLINTTNTFTVPQKIVDPSSTDAPLLTVQKTGSTAFATDDKYLLFINSANATTDCALAAFGNSAVVNTFGIKRNSSDHVLKVNTTGTPREAQTWYSTGGVAIGAPTGGDKGNGALNVQSLYANGVPVLSTALNHAWVEFTITAGVLAVAGGSGIGSIARNSAGKFTINFAVPFSSNVYGIFGMTSRVNSTAGSSIVVAQDAPPTTASCVIYTQDSSGNGDNTYNFLLFVGT